MDEIEYKPFGEWLKQADYDFGTAEAMFNTGRYVYAIFMCHLSIEKSLKALYVKNHKKIPPKTHNLQYLLKQLPVTLKEEFRFFLFRLNDASIPTRYPQELEAAIKIYNKKITKDILENTKLFLQWIKQL